MNRNIRLRVQRTVCGWVQGEKAFRPLESDFTWWFEVFVSGQGFAGQSSCLIFSAYSLHSFKEICSVCVFVACTDYLSIAYYGLLSLYLICGFIVLLSQNIASPWYYWKMNRITSKSLHNHKWTVYSCKVICHWGHRMALIKHLITLRTQIVSGIFSFFSGGYLFLL